LLRALAEITRLTSSASRYTRANAVWALRRIPRDEAVRTQIALLSDDEENVRERAVGSLVDRAPSDELYDACVDRALRERDPAIRRSVYRLLFGMRRSRPEVVVAFQRAAQTDADADNRALAAEYVQDLSLSGGDVQVEGIR
jgi:HEAT repeat protein